MSVRVFSDISFRNTIFVIIIDVDGSGVFRYFQKNTIFEVFLDAFCRGVSDFLMKIYNFVNACEQ